MKLNDLLEVAKSLPKISNSSIDEYDNKKEILINEINNTIINRKDLLQLIGRESNKEMMRNNHHNHVLYMINLFKQFNANNFVSTVIWVMQTYQKHSFSPLYWSAQLSSWDNILRRNLSDSSYDEIIVFYNFMITNLPIFNQLAKDESE